MLYDVTETYNSPENQVPAAWNPALDTPVETLELPPTQVEPNPELPEQLTLSQPEVLASRGEFDRGALLRDNLFRAYDARVAISPVETMDVGTIAEPLSIPAGDIDPEVTTEPAVVDDFSQLGAAFLGRRPPQTFWNEQAVNLVSNAGLQQGQLSAEQAEQNRQLAQTVLASDIESGATTPLAFTAGDLALLVNESGVEYSHQDPNQLRAATSYVNDANDVTDQQERLRKTLDVFHTLDNGGMPQLTRDEMIGQLWVAARVPTHAVQKMSDAELARVVQDVATVVNGPAGQHKLKVGKHDVKLTVNEQNVVVDSSTKKPNVWAKIGKIALTVASFVPGPVGIAARIASSVISAAEGIKNKNWMQAVIGGASGVAAGAGAIAGRAITGAAATTARVADSIARGARAWQAGLQAARAHDLSGVFNSIAGAGAAVAGAVGDSADTVATWARGVERWAGRAYVASEVRNISQMGFSDQLLAVGRHGANLILDSGDVRPASSSFEVRWKLGINFGQTIRAGLQLQDAVRSGDVLLMSEAAAGLRVVSQNTYRNLHTAPQLINYFDSQQSAATIKRSDLQYDGYWIGAGGAASVSGSATPPITPNGTPTSNVPTVYVNGVLNTVTDQTVFMQGYANASGLSLHGIHNASQGIFRDIWQSLNDKLDRGKNPPVDTLADYVYEQLEGGGNLNLVGHSQGALIISRALDDVRRQLRLEDRLSPSEIEARLSRITVTTFGGASGHYPDGPQYFHYINRGDYVAMPVGLGGDLLRGVRLLHAGRNAQIIRFTDFSQPNAHSSSIYLNMYRRPETFANGKNPYTPEEIKRFQIGR